MPPHNELRYTLECCDLAWRITRVDEQTSLARPPSVVVEAFTDQQQLLTATIERMSASLLIEGQGMSRVVRGWIRHVEHLGTVGSLAHVYLHLVPVDLPSVRRSLDPILRAQQPLVTSDPQPKGAASDDPQTTAKLSDEVLQELRDPSTGTALGRPESIVAAPPPAATPSSKPPAQRTVPLTADDLRKLRITRKPIEPKIPAKLERTQRIETQLGPRPPAGSSDAPTSSQPAAPAPPPAGSAFEPQRTAPLAWHELEALHTDPQVPSTPPDRPKHPASTTQETRQVSPEDLAVLREIRKNRPPRK